jgi:hypothetical protein
MCFEAMPGAWIEAARQQMRVDCKHGAVLWKDDFQGWSTFRFKEHGSAADDARAAKWCRLGTVCRGRLLEAKRDIQLLEARGPSLSSTSESVRG